MGFRGWIRCRKCTACLRVRTSDWVSRVLYECHTHKRLWFITFTYRSTGLGYPEFQAYCKRLRKRFAFRYVCTREFGGKNGRFHLHALLHCGTDLKKRDVESKWSAGFIKCKLVPAAKSGVVARYVSKYVHKGGRVSASVSYGLRKDLTNATLGYLVAVVLRDFPGSAVSRIAGVKVPFRIRRGVAPAPVGFRRHVGRGSDCVFSAAAPLEPSGESGDDFPLEPPDPEVGDPCASPFCQDWACHGECLNKRPSLLTTLK